MDLDPAICERARLSRDARFDGRFFIAVVTTGIYCRPVCPVRLPKAQNVRFMPTAAAAAEAGFRPCLRCRPEASPGTPAWLGTSATVSRALRLIGDGALDAGNVDDLASKLGIGARHLHRLFLRHLGASPVAVAQTRRLHFAKKLLDETELSMSEVALSSGFGSVRRFNAVLRATYDRSPSELRARAQRGRRLAVGDGFRFRLPYRAPFAWDELVAFLALRATPGVECVEAHRYRRSIAVDGVVGTIEVAPVDGEDCLSLLVGTPGSPSLLRIAERVKRIFDLGADPCEIDAQLSSDATLSPLVKARPGLRVPGAWDPFELAVRAILGQQVSVRGATTLAGRLAERCGQEVEGAAAGAPARVFPTPELVCEADLAGLGLTGARERSIRALARAVCEGELRLDTGCPLDERVSQLTRIPGIGAWTAHYVAMRGLGEPDAFPVGDLGLAKAAAARGAPPLGAKALGECAEAWRPWRAYAAMHLWSSGRAGGRSPGPRGRAAQRAGAGRPAAKSAARASAGGRP